LNVGCYKLKKTIMSMYVLVISTCASAKVRAAFVLEMK